MGCECQIQFIWPDPDGCADGSASQESPQISPWLAERGLLVQGFVKTWSFEGMLHLRRHATEQPLNCVPLKAFERALYKALLIVLIRRAS